MGMGMGTRCRALVASVGSIRKSLDFRLPESDGLEFKEGIVVCKGQRERERATSHKRLRACDHFTSSTLIGGKGGAGPSSLHTMLEGPTEYVNTRWV
jgi:hypothetical protein